MDTKIVNFDERTDELKRQLLDGKVIAFPTETVYGIGCDLFSIDGVYNIFNMKNRSINKPLAAHISDLNQVETLSDDIPEVFYKLAERFLPGPLSLIIPKSRRISSLVTGGMNTIGIRVPDNDIFRKLSKTFGKPIAATSANESGKSDKLSSSEVYEEFRGAIEYIINDKELHYKKASTVLSLAGGIKILREGAVNKQDIEDFLKMKL